MNVTGVSIEVSTACSRCQAPLPLNGASESALCDKCQSPNETPASFWQAILAEAIGSALALAPDTSRPMTIMMSGRTIKCAVGRQDARCASCKTPFDPSGLEHAAAAGKIFCTSCGAQSAARRAPDWFKAIHPAAQLLVGETLGATTAHVVAPGELRFHCYHCGAPLPLDGTTRAVPCGHCRAQVMVPDDIWLRLHPARTIDRWYAVLAIDLSAAKGVLPEDVMDFCDVAVEPGGNVIIAYRDNRSGPAGHPARLALLTPSGVLTWLQDGIEFSDDAVLVTSPVDGTCFLADRKEDFVRAIDPRTGDPIRTIAKTMSVEDLQSIAIDWDGSFLVLTRKLRRFDRDGRPIPTWPGMRVGEGENAHEIEWPTWPRTHPVAIPTHTKVRIGWDGAAYFVDEEHGIAKYTRDGQLVGVVTFPPNIVGEVFDATIARDGTLTAVFEHAVPLGDHKWAHVLRVAPNGQFSVVLGPHVQGSPLIGRWGKRLKGAPDGTMILASEVSSLRVLAPDASIRWMTNQTRRDEEHEAKQLAEDRRGKKVVADRE